MVAAVAANMLIPGTSSNGSEKPLLDTMRKLTLAEYVEQEDGINAIIINLNTFPAKLWRLVNNPQVHSVYWDPSGLGIVIDQPMFEDEVLGPVNGLKNQDKFFETTNFSSFLRQLNLYGFRKVLACLSDSEIPKEIKVTLIKGSQHCFYSPNFKRGHPKLLCNLKRLTITNKAKIEAGLEVKSRRPNLSQQAKVYKSKTKNNGFGHPESLQEGRSPDLFPQNGPLLMNGSDRTSKPQCGLNMGPSESSLLPSTSPKKNCFPFLVTQDMPIWCPVQTVPTGMPVELGPQTVAPPDITYNLLLSPPPYQPGYHASWTVQAGPGHPESLQGGMSPNLTPQNGPLLTNSSDHTFNPQCGWIMGPIDSSFPFTSSMENCIPLSVIPYMPTSPVQCVPSAMPVEPGPQTVTPPEISCNLIPLTLYQPGFYVPGSVQAGPSHPESLQGGTSPDMSLQNGPLLMNSDSDHTSSPQCGSIMGPGDSSLPFTPYMENCIPFRVMPYTPTWPVQSVPTAMLVESGPQTVAPPETLYQPGFYVPAMDLSLLVIPDVRGYAHQPLSSSYYNYYQPGFPMGLLHPCNQQRQTAEK